MIDKLVKIRHILDKLDSYHVKSVDGWLIVEVDKINPPLAGYEEGKPPLISEYEYEDQLEHFWDVYQKVKAVYTNARAIIGLQSIKIIIPPDGTCDCEDCRASSWESYDM